ncbi:hypothetical protein OEZ49_22265 [Ruegeria sp. WL0004]|uniref:Uncharacterized protein n=1 Tax=Ruegeria marisflavi TaxID=2984152 RepID=A0ABT2X327_9RHOB|nr:hypothetical protein [Ruegeria sp. WL0004]MCU9840478.1 hypothetical protein [Ruegeria sp. WL0004]
MGKVLTGILGLVIGAALGIFLVAPFMTGTAAGVGIATGLSAGICATIQAAQEEQLLTPGQIDQVLNRAAADMAALSGEAAPEEMVGGVDECSEVMERLRSSG